MLFVEDIVYETDQLGGELYSATGAKLQDPLLASEQGLNRFSVFASIRKLAITFAKC